MLKISKSAEKAISMLAQSGYEAYCVGGCVRDMLLGIAVNDFDITTSALPSEMKQVFKSERVIETGIKHGTLTVIIDNEAIEITTYRIDGEYKDSRHPEAVSFTRSLKEDLSRRDFTVNAIVYNRNSGVKDLFGGIADIEKGIIRAIGDPDKRFSEDALRILRAIRFSSTLGFEIEEKTKEAMIRKKSLIKNISPERIASELNKLLLGKNVKNALLENSEILAEIIPELEEMKGFDQCNKWHIYDILEHTAVAVESTPRELHLRLTMLLHDTGKVHTFFKDENGVGHFYGHNEKSAEIAKRFFEKYKYDNKTSEAVYKLVKIHDTPTQEESVLIKKRLNRWGKDTFFDLIKVQRADNMAQNPLLVNLSHFDTLEKMAQEIEQAECYSMAKLKISGKDLLTLGIPEGKIIGEVLTILLDEVIDNKILNEHTALLCRAKEIYQENN